MPNEYYDSTGAPAQSSHGSSSVMRAEFDAIEAGFAKLPPLAGNAGKAVVVNGAGNALTVTAATLSLAVGLTTTGAGAITLTSTGATNVTLPTTGTLATLAGTETLTNKTLTSPTINGATFSGTLDGTVTFSGSVTSNTFASSGATLTGGSIDNMVIGGVTPAAGAFTTLSASSNATIGGTLGVTGNATVGGTLGVTGAATFSSTVAATGNVSSGGQFLAAAGTVSAPAYSFTDDSDSGIFQPAAANFGFAFNGTERMRFAAQSSGSRLLLLSPSDGTYFLGAAIAGGTITSPDIQLARDAANTLALRNSTNAQIFRVYRTYTDGSNYRRLSISAEAGDGVIAFESAGTGIGTGLLYLHNRQNGAISFGTNNTDRWQITSSGHFVGATDNTYDIGASGTSRPRDLYLARDLTVGGNTTLGDASGDTLTINAGAWTIRPTFNAAMAAGILAAGSTSLGTWSASFSGAAGGTTDARSHNFNLSSGGASAIAGMRAMTVTLSHNGTATLASGMSVLGQLSVNSTGGVTGHSIFNTFVNLAGGGVVTDLTFYNVQAPTITAGSLGTARGILINNLGHASTGVAVGVRIVDFTNSATMRGIQSSLSAGSGKHNLYIDGTAVNYIAGQIQAGDGSVSAPAYAFASEPDMGFYNAGSDVMALVTNGVRRLSVGGGHGGAFVDNGALSIRNLSGGLSTGAVLAADSDNVLAQRNGTSAQGLRIYNTFTDSSNHERIHIDWTTTANVAVIGTTFAGTGSSRELRLRTGGASPITMYPGGTIGFRVEQVSSSVNYIQVGGGPTGSTPYIFSGGSDTNVSLAILSKGTGSIRCATGSTIANEQFRIAHVASAVNFIQVAGNATGSRPVISVLGSDTNVGLVLSTKGTGVYSFYTNSNVEQFRIGHTASAVNYLQATGGATGNPPSLTAQGSDPDIDVLLAGKGTGQVLGTLDIIPIAASDETTPINAGAGKITYHLPYDFEVISVMASLTEPASSGTFTVDININGSSILSTKLTIDEGEETSLTAATPAVLSSTSLEKGDKLMIDVDDDASGDAAGLKVTLIGRITGY